MIISNHWLYLFSNMVAKATYFCYNFHLSCYVKHFITEKHILNFIRQALNLIYPLGNFTCYPSNICCYLHNRKCSSIKQGKERIKHMWYTNVTSHSDSDSNSTYLCKLILEWIWYAVRWIWSELKESGGVRCECTTRLWQKSSCLNRFLLPNLISLLG